MSIYTHITLVGVSAAVLPKHMPNFRAVGKLASALAISTHTKSTLRCLLQYWDGFQVVVTYLNEIPMEFHSDMMPLPGVITRELSVHVLIQWEMTLHCNVVSHWLGAYTKWPLHNRCYPGNLHPWYWHYKFIIPDDFYLCQATQHVYADLDEFTISWLENSARKPLEYTRGQNDRTELDCVITHVRLRRVEGKKDTYYLPEDQKLKIENSMTGDDSEEEEEEEEEDESEEEEEPPPKRRKKPAKKVVSKKTAKKPGAYWNCQSLTRCGLSDCLWQQRSGSALAQVMAWCLMAPSHYLNRCWLIIS